MAELTYDELIERADYYRHDTGLIALHNAARNYWHPLVKGTHRPTLPDFFTRGAMVDMPSPDLDTFMQGLLADFDSYQSITSVSARGVDGGAPTQALMNQAEKIERFATVLFGDLSNGGRLQRSRIWSMGYGPFAVNALRLTTDEEGNPDFVVDDCDPFSCYFPVSGSPDRPAIMVRDYEVIASKAIAQYSDKAQKRKPAKNVSGAWDWVALTDDSAAQQPDASPRQGSGKAFAELVRVIWVDDGDNIYHVLMNKTAAEDPEMKSGGKIVYSEPNLTGGCSALIVAGRETPMREVMDRISPAHLPLLTCTYNLNLLTAMRGTRMMQIRPDLAVEYSPEQIQAAVAAGILVPAGQAAVAQSVEIESSGGPVALHYGGKVIPWQFAPNEDMVALAEQWTTTKDRYFADWRQPTDQATVADARVNTYLAATEAIYRRQTTQLKASDWADTMLVKMALNVIKESEERRKGKEPGFESDPARMATYTRYARGGEATSSGEIEAGHGVTLTAKDLEDIDYELSVATKSQTESDRRAVIANGMQEVAWKVTGLRQVIEKAYVDGQSQMQYLAEDNGLQQLEPLATQVLYSTFQQYVQETGGIMLPDLNTLAQPAASGGGGGTGAAPMQAPSIPGPSGGASPQ